MSSQNTSTFPPLAPESRLVQAIRIWSLPLALLLGLIGFTSLIWGVPTATTWALGVWAGAVAVLVFSVSQAMTQNRWRERRMARYARALEMLAGMSAHIIGRVGAGDEIWQRIPQAARELLGMSMACICVLEDEGRIVRLVGSAGVDPPLGDYHSPLSEFPTAQECVQTGRPVTVSDLKSDARPINRLMAQTYRIRSVLQVPMMVEGSAIGVVMLGDRRPRKFTSADVRLAQLWGGIAAVAVANERLYRQTRSDAETRAMLLRELNHRVKNNLAGIAALLSINRPALAPSAEQWVKRVVDRIRTLARTHEMMLTTGTDRVNVCQLAEITLQSLSMVTPPGVKTRCEMVGGRVLLRNDRTVSVAMILHELCYNALAHGLSENGSLLVRSGVSPDRMLCLEVIDDGCGFNDNAPAGRGLGLNLVRDFVSRELRGEFALQSAPGKGTTATVKFALLEDEAPDAV